MTERPTIRDAIHEKADRDGINRTVAELAAIGITPIGYIVTATRDGVRYFPGDDYELEEMFPTLEEAQLRCTPKTDGIWTTGVAAVIPVTQKEN